MCIKYGRGDTHITGMTINGTPVEDFEIYGNVQIETPKTNTVTYTVHVGNGCDPSMPNGIEPKQPVVIGQSDHPGGDEPGGNTRNSSLSVDAEDGTAHIFNAILDREQSGPATLMVFDASGRLVFEGAGWRVPTSRPSVSQFPMNGVYIVKAITQPRGGTYPKDSCGIYRKQHSNNAIKPIMRRVLYSIAVYHTYTLCGGTGV